MFVDFEMNPHCKSTTYLFFFPDDVNENRIGFKSIEKSTTKI